jgi:hypothetical protein
MAAESTLTTYFVAAVAAVVAVAVVAAWSDADFELEPHPPSVSMSDPAMTPVTTALLATRALPAVPFSKSLAM